MIYLISILPGVAAFLLKGMPPLLILPLAFATLGVVLLQHGINVLNDVTDWVRGADTEKSSSWVRWHALDLSLTSRHGWLSLILGGAVGVYSLHLAQRYSLLAFAFPFVALGYSYNAGKRPLSYSRFGEWVTAICYGPGVFGSLWLLGDPLAPLVGILGSVGFGALACSVLLSHQPAQVLSDARAGKLSFAVRHGAVQGTRTAHRLLLLSLVCFALAASMAPVHSFTRYAAWSIAAALAVWVPRQVSPGSILQSAGSLCSLLFLLEGAQRC